MEEQEIQTEKPKEKKILASFLYNLKKSLPCIALTSAILAVLLALYFLLCAAAPGALVKKYDGKGFYTKRILIMGNNLLAFASREMSLKKLEKSDFNDFNFSPAIYSLDHIASIEFDKEAFLPKLKIKKSYLGTYKIKLQGHRGTLRLYIKKRRLKGYVKFHTWGKRAYEPLKRVSIKGNRIFFIRSANSSKEIRRIGANIFFTQTFNGKFSPSGKTVKGYMKNNRGERHIWEAKKKRKR